MAVERAFPSNVEHSLYTDGMYQVYLTDTNEHTSPKIEGSAGILASKGVHTLTMTRVKFE